MKKILGLDLGTTSIGWAIISVDEDNSPQSVLGIGSRIIPLSVDDATEFSHGNVISKNAKRTQRRTLRKSYDRYQQRRENLTKELKGMNMLPDEYLIKLPAIDLWNLRARSVKERVSLSELGRILYHINQKRGYKSSKADIASNDKSQNEYVQAVSARHQLIQEFGQTIGQYFYDRLKEDQSYRIKNQVFPRKAYEEEFDAIISHQQQFYPETLTSARINRLRNEIIFYQRKLKSCKHLVSICDFEKKTFINSRGEQVISGPKVAPRSSPLFQTCKIWESVNNLILKNRNGITFDFSDLQRQALFHHLDNNPKLSLSDLYRILGLNKSDGWWGGKAIGKGLTGNTTKVKIADALGNVPNRAELLRFNLQLFDAVDASTGEIIPDAIVDRIFEREPLYQLWHTLYSISDRDELEAALRNNFHISDADAIDRLCRIDFVKEGFGNKSAKAMRRIIPYLQQGMMYSQACAAAGFRHSESLTIEENAARPLKERIDPIRKNELRQPVVEKILNQMINVVNAIIEQYGAIDEVRVELARELKQSKDERNETYISINKRERENASIAERIESEYRISASRSRIEKFRLWEEAEHRCFYCGQPVGVKEFLSGYDVEVEHIIPKMLLFDNSYSNKVCSCRKCNGEKSNATAFDYMRTKSTEAFEDYKKRVAEYFKNKRISKSKYEKLLTSRKDIPTDFIERQLRETQYIARKSKELLATVCRNVYSTSGSVTDLLRHVWGYDQILHELNFDRYNRGGLTTVQTFEHRGQTHQEARIIDWSKRIDHRHHALDALTIASTSQRYINRINKLNTERDQMFAELTRQSDEYQKNQNLLERWIAEQPHFSVQQVTNAVAGILVSFKAGKKATSTGKRIEYRQGKRIVRQEGILVPRGPLSEESVYGRIKAIEKKKPVKFLFENPDLIFQPRIRDLVKTRLAQYNGDSKQALSSLKSNPIYLDKKSTVPLEYATCFKDEYVLRYPVASLEEKHIKDVVDQSARDAIAKRLHQFENNPKLAFKDLENSPVYLDEANKLPIKNVRLFTRLTAVETLRNGYCKPANNHHIAIYSDRQDVLHEHLVTFWHAVERKKYGMPAIILNPETVWDSIGGKEISESFLEKLPDVTWNFKFSMQQNEMFILGMPEEEFEQAIEQKDNSALGQYLYKVQNISEQTYRFCFHTETQFDPTKMNKPDKRFLNIRSLGALLNLNLHKVRVNLLGEISLQ